MPNDEHIQPDPVSPPTPPLTPPSPLSTPGVPTAGQRLDNLIAKGKAIGDRATPKMKQAGVSANETLNKLSHTRPWLKPVLIGVGGLVAVLFLVTAFNVLFGGKASPPQTNGQGGVEAVDASSGPALAAAEARQKLVATSNKMGGTDAQMTRVMLDLHASAFYAVGWQGLDECMFEVTPETQTAYRVWRQAMLAMPATQPSNVDRRIEDKAVDQAADGVEKSVSGGGDRVRSKQ